MSPRRTLKCELAVQKLVEGYLAAFEVVLGSGFADEIDWQERRRIDHVTEPVFLREVAWVILSAGMKEAVVRQRFPAISEAFLGWASAASIVRERSRCSRTALLAFNHDAKIAAIIKVAEMVVEQSFGGVLSGLLQNGVDAFEALPYIGPVTKFHLAKNLGVDVAKPDRHLVRLARSAGCASPQRLCQLIAAVTGDRVATVDLVLWRYATITPTYRCLFERS